MVSTIFIQPPVFVSIAEVAVGSSVKPWKNPFHLHKDTELVFILEGEGEFIVDDAVYLLKRGDAIVHYPLIEHQEASVKNAELRAVSVFFKGLELAGKPKGMLTADGESPLFQLQDNFATVCKLLTEVLSEYHDEKPGFIDVNSSLLQTLLLLLLRNQAAAKSSSTSSVAGKVKTYIEENYAVDLTLSDLADIVYISPYHLAHVFKEEMGISPIQYLIKCRIEEAKKLLRQSELSVSDISATVGYPNANYFNILFKKVTGENPGKYRTKRG